VKDDGAFELPASVLQVVQSGFAAATFSRDVQAIVRSADKAILVIGRVQASHRARLPGLK
jgi:hypothetical protein